MGAVKEFLKIRQKWMKDDFIDQDSRELINILGRLVVYKSMIGEMEVTARKVAQDAEVVRKHEYATRLKLHKKSGMTVSEAQASAEIDIFELRNDETNADGNARYLRHIYEDAGIMIMSIQSRAKYIESEKASVSGIT